MPTSSDKLRKPPITTSPVGSWFLTHPRSVTLCALLAVVAASAHLLVRSLNAYQQNSIEIIEESTEAIVIFEFIRKSYLLCLWLLLPVLSLHLIRARREGPPFKGILMASLAIFAAWIATEITKAGASRLQLAGVEPSAINSAFRLILIGSIILSPPIIVALYSRAPLLSRYILRQFFTPFAYCLSGFIIIWLIIDLSDNGPDFFDAKASLSTVLRYYTVQVPQVIVMILPITLLLALLYSLSRMSKSNEIISMISAGQSLRLILMPLFLSGFYLSLVSLALNYEWAPEAEARKEAVMSEMKESASGKKKRYAAYARLYRNREDRRTWFVGRIPFDLAGDKLGNIEIYQADKSGNTKLAYFAERAAWNYFTREWRLIRGATVSFDSSGNVLSQYRFDVRVISNWRETPWKIFSGSLVPEQLGVPGLAFHIKTNSDQPERLLASFKTHWHYRWALPWSCLGITLIAAPMGIVFSRQGMMSSVAAALIIFFGMLVCENICLALAQSMRIPAFFGAWTTNILLILGGMLVLHFKSRHRELPKPGLAGALKWVNGKIFRNKATPSITP
ncbi:MAG: YjgP/YjgQ family permease [Verrucomicrobiaceae bacterium]|nr:YjgP/YjgQ family permease [Verrucomicrobiaceae bacterium]